ncbi:hypothetical protein K469DRAFT_580117 [Zopfia rhizophila CBS 207.26]|uniref:MADS-box domain-containing protein n=1 Tax=Zopfia rhizophila CBS 207.26 TaxID=1314779 RepID=A0A6A6E285_9PEZI|nr:hypothetical protein K469DRAFT_580117 [Zopfia rhizophila CBS 207.26]
MLSQLRTKRVENENYRKRLETLGSKSSELCRDYKAEVYFVAYRNGRFYTFTSTDEPSWPPGPDTLVSLFPFTLYRDVTPIKGKLYPPPVKKSPAHFKNRRQAKVAKRKFAGAHQPRK